ncbi:MAG: hypothetical protein PHT94_02145 [Candidatus Nanoarchaeia archaeon]|nr:hypothetical protein [Candidatus Nanoarchaeia archaeon]
MVLKNVVDFGFEQQTAQINPDYEYITNEPKSDYRKHFYFMDYSLNVEKLYYKIVEFLKEEKDFNEIDKIFDTFTASESSSYWGTIQQRLSIQQEKLHQYLASIGTLLKELMTIVKDMRILKEKLKNYEDACEFTTIGKNPKKVGKKITHKNKAEKNEEHEYNAAEIALKGYWVDYIEGGAQNPGSVYGLQKNLNYVSLPDLFFSVHVTSLDEIDSRIKELKYNESVKTVLARKLRAYMNWKVHTYDELTKALMFSKQYLIQHHRKILMYLEWVKPYLKTVKRLSPNTKKLDDIDLISAFEASILEIEFLAKKKTGKKNEKDEDLYYCVLIDILSKTKPEMGFQGKEYGKNGPIHLGSVELTINSYLWSEEQIKKFKRLRLFQDFQILGEINKTIQTTIQTLGDEIGDIINDEELDELVDIFGDKDKNKDSKDKENKDSKDKKDDDKSDKKDQNLSKELRKRLNPFFPIEMLLTGFIDLFKFLSPNLSMKKKIEEAKNKDEELKENIKELKKNLSDITKDLYKDSKKLVGAINE